MASIETHMAIITTLLKIANEKLEWGDLNAAHVSISKACTQYQFAVLQHEDVLTAETKKKLRELKSDMQVTLAAVNMEHHKLRYTMEQGHA